MMDINQAVQRLFEQERVLSQQLTSWPLMQCRPAQEQCKLSAVSPQAMTEDRREKSEV